MRTMWRSIGVIQERKEEREHSRKLGYSCGGALSEGLLTGAGRRETLGGDTCRGFWSVEASLTVWYLVLS